MKKYFKMQKGFTLIEGVLAIAVLGVGLVGVMFSFQGGTQSSLLADQTVIATNIARGTLEKILAKRDADGYAATLVAVNTSNSYDENPVTNFSNYVLDTTALEVDPDDDDAIDDFLDASAGSGYARVTVQVSWGGGEHSITMETLIADYTAP